MCGAGIVEPEENDARLPTLRQRCDFTEVEVERQDDPLLRGGLGEDLDIGGAMKALLAQVARIVAAHTSGLLLAATSQRRFRARQRV